MTDSSLYRDDSRVRHMLDAMERITDAATAQHGRLLVANFQTAELK